MSRWWAARLGKKQQLDDAEPATEDMPAQQPAQQHSGSQTPPSSQQCPPRGRPAPPPAPAPSSCGQSQGGRGRLRAHTGASRHLGSQRRRSPGGGRAAAGQLRGWPRPAASSAALECPGRIDACPQWCRNRLGPALTADALRLVGARLVQPGQVAAAGGVGIRPHAAGGCHVPCGAQQGAGTRNQRRHGGEG